MHPFLNRVPGSDAHARVGTHAQHLLAMLLARTLACREMRLQLHPRKSGATAPSRGAAVGLNHNGEGPFLRTGIRDNRAYSRGYGPQPCEGAGSAGREETRAGPSFVPDSKGRWVRSTLGSIRNMIGVRPERVSWDVSDCQTPTRARGGGECVAKT